MKKFKFVGDPTEYSWPTVEVDRVYSGDLYVENWGSSVQEAALEYPEDWEEVTEREKKPYFKFIGNPDDYTVIKKGEIVPFGFQPKEWGKPVQYYAESFPDDWQKVEEGPTWIFEPANQDQLASSMTKFEMAVFMVLQGLSSNPEHFRYDSKDLVNQAITQATETFKQLENEKHL